MQLFNQLVNIDKFEEPESVQPVKTSTHTVVVDMGTATHTQPVLVSVVVLPTSTGEEHTL